jgi:hypothetical protein
MVYAMNRLFVVFAVGAMFATGGSAQSQDSSTEQYFKAKHGRSTPKTEARQKAEQANTAWREDPSAQAQTRRDTQAEDAFKAKRGRNTPKEEARQKAQQANTAWRDDQSATVDRSDTQAEQVFKAKYGRSTPRKANSK